MLRYLISGAVRIGITGREATGDVEREKKKKARLVKSVLTRRNSWPTAPVTPTMATEGPSAFFPARGAKARDLPDVRLLLLERAAGLAAAPEEERDEESIWLKSGKRGDRTESVRERRFLAFDARPLRKSRAGGAEKDASEERQRSALAFVAAPDV